MICHICPYLKCTGNVAKLDRISSYHMTKTFPQSGMYKCGNGLVHHYFSRILLCTIMFYSHYDSYIIIPSFFYPHHMIYGLMPIYYGTKWINPPYPTPLQFDWRRWLQPKIWVNRVCSETTALPPKASRQRIFTVRL